MFDSEEAAIRDLMDKYDCPRGDAQAMIEAEILIQQAEMRNAFGPGTTVVDVITGQKWVTGA